MHTHTPGFELLNGSWVTQERVSSQVQLILHVMLALSNTHKAISRFISGIWCKKQLARVQNSWTTGSLKFSGYRHYNFLLYLWICPSTCMYANPTLCLIFFEINALWSVCSAVFTGHHIYNLPLPPVFTPSRGFFNTKITHSKRKAVTKGIQKKKEKKKKSTYINGDRRWPIKREGKRDTGSHRVRGGIS